MKYAESKEQSSELLRMLLPLMSRHAAAFHPLSYAVWYEYVSGINPGLRLALDHRLKRDALISEEEIRALYQQHIADPENGAAERLQANLRRVMDEVSREATAAGQRADSYGDKLGEFGHQLSQGGPDTVMPRMVESLLRETREMKGSVSELQGKLRSSSEEVESLRKALHSAVGEALTDPLTGLKNRRGFDRVVAEALSLKPEGLKGYGLMMVDIDHFKRVNDEYGHVFGDKVLRSIAQVLDSMVRGRDAVARFGGEEFAVLLPETGVEGARLLADRIRSTIANGRVRRHDSSDQVGNITVSVGVAGYNPGESVESFIDRADKALYASKQNGRNRVSVAENADRRDQTVAA
jgi:diguanylate cyclase